MTLLDLLRDLFPLGHSVTAAGPLVTGSARTAAGEAAVVGTTGSPALGIPLLLDLGRCYRRILAETPARPIVLLVDNSGQRMGLTEELLGLSQYIANLLAWQDLARRRGHRQVAVIYGRAVAGGFIAFGLQADRIAAVPDAHVAVMELPVVARVTKLPMEDLQALARTVPVFAPGIENFYAMGGVHEIWRTDLAGHLARALREADGQDTRAALGAARGGRKLAAGLVDEIVQAPLCSNR